MSGDHDPDRRIGKLYDGYVQDVTSRREFLDRAAVIEASLMLHQAQLDERANASWPAFEKGLEAAGVQYVNYDYDGAQHGFHNDTTPRFDEKAAELAWTKTVEFFNRNLDTDG